MAAGATYAKGSTRVLYTARSFYGTHKVVLEPPTTRTLAHGNTTHGAQDLAPDRRREPLTYYHRTGPIGGVMTAWQGRPQRRRVGVVGLGAGSLAAYAAPGERWTFFEIDDVVIDIARDRGLFAFLGDARGEVDVVPGDARLSLAAVPDATFGLLVLDAFSSDGVPAHLLTQEAIALYLRKLAPGGVLAVHLSNRYLDLQSVVAGDAAALGLAALVRFDSPTEAEARAWKTASHWMVLGRTPTDLAPLAPDPRWIAPAAAGPGWTDDASNLWGSLHLLGR
jgi:SAM-dependent methyltransferase